MQIAFWLETANVAGTGHPGVGANAHGAGVDEGAVSMVARSGASARPSGCRIGIESG